MHEVGHLLPLTEYYIPGEADQRQSEELEEPRWYVSEYAMEYYSEVPSETMSAWFIARCILHYETTNEYGDKLITGGWAWGFHQALFESLPNQMAYFDEFFRDKDMSPYTCEIP